mgnify:CR=1 FL=1
MKRLSRTVREIWQKRMKAEQTAEDAFPATATVRTGMEVCPNRANIALVVPGMEKHQIIHVDYMCNECGNCRSFCPWDSAPYLDKFTLFANEADMADSTNQGFAVLDAEKGACKVRLQGNEFAYQTGTADERVPEGIAKIIETVIRDYSYLIL